MRSVRVMTLSTILFASFALVALQAPARAQEGGQIDTKVFDRLEWRSIGPCNMGGRIGDVVGAPGNPNIVYVGAAAGGIFKTTNAGMTWTPVFERQGVSSIGALALEPNNPDVVWAGTGESAVRNTVSMGDGVYKSNDGGKSWQHMGLKDTEHISKILVHPKNPDIVYVAALGHAFGPNSERGVFITTDGGKTWTKTLFIDNEHGVCDMDIDPNNPNIIYAGMWCFDRKPWTFHSGSEKGGVFRSVDGGRTWSKLTNNLPKLMGRIGIAVAPSNSNVVYVIVESKEGTLYRSDDRGDTFKQVSKQGSIVSRGFYYTHVRVDPVSEDRVYAVASTLFVSVDGGKTFQPMSPKTHIDYHAFWIDPKNPARMWQGQDGGIAVSNDRGEHWDYINNIPLGQIYHVHADNRQPFYYVSGGLQDNGGWTGPSRTREPAGILNDEWVMINFGDGFWVVNHADDPNLYLSESQSGYIVRTDYRTREQQAVGPQVRGGGPASSAKYRFNWDTPIILSPHDKNTVWFAGNVVFKSTDFGKTWTAISPDLTTNDASKLKDAGGPISYENSSAEYYCTIIALAESPVQPGQIWAGTDDGNLQLTTDGGKSWNNLIKNIPEIAPNSPVSHVEASHINANIAYVAFNRHMFDDFRPYIFKTEDGGRKWKNVAGNLPDKAYVHVVREDPKNHNLIYAGTELGLFVSYTGGKEWSRLTLKNLPVTPIRDVLVHPRENDLILATHGRSFYILDDATVVQQMTPAISGSFLYMFDVRPALRFTSRFTRYGIGDKVFAGQNPGYGALITYYLKDKPDDKTKVKIQVLDSSGKLIREIADAPKEQGLNRTTWALNYDAPRPRSAGAGEGGFEGFGGSSQGPEVMPGRYTVKVIVGDKTVEKQVEVRMDPTVTVSAADLQAQHDAATKLRDILSTANDALKALDNIRSQIEQIEKTVTAQMPDAPADLKKAIGDAKKKVEEVQDSLISPRGTGLGLRVGGPRFVEEIFPLYGNIINVNAAPTPAQRDFFNTIQAQLPEKLNPANKVITETVPQLNEILRRNNAPTVVPPKPVALGK